jgi:hypothetical protein
MGLAVGILLISVAAAMLVFGRERPDGSQPQFLKSAAVAQLYVFAFVVVLLFGVSGIVSWIIGWS